MPESLNAEHGSSHSPRARRQVFNSLSTRIIFFVFLSTFLSALVVSWISIHAIQSQLMADLDRRFPALLDDRLTAVEATMTGIETGLAALADSPTLGRRLAARSPDVEALSTWMSARMTDVPGYSGLLVLDSKGVPLSSVGTIDHTVRQAAVVALDLSGELDHTTTATLSGDGSPPGLLILQRVGSANAPDGWIGAHLGFSSFAAALMPDSDEGNTRISLVGEDGQILASTDAEPRTPLSQGQLARITEGKVHEYTTAEHLHVLGAARALPHGHWTLLIEAPFEEAFSPVLSVVSRIFISDLAIILVFSFLAYKITATIMRPIRALSEGARKISRGDYDHAIPDAPANDEIGLLIRTFNDMLAQLRRNATEIDDDQRRLTDQNEELQRANEVLAQLSITDGLTKLHNHRYFQDHLTREIKRIGRTGEALSMILMDLDDFKKLNDLYGHSAGDELLVGVANILIDSVRESDLLARYGGEEFVILAPGTTIEGAISMAEKIRMAIEDSSHIVDDSMRPIRVTISIGVAAYEGDRREFFQAADRALYDAKAQGKNCVIAAEPDPTR